MVVVGPAKLDWINPVFVRVPPSISITMTLADVRVPLFVKSVGSIVMALVEATVVLLAMVVVPLVVVTAPPFRFSVPEEAPLSLLNVRLPVPDELALTLMAPVAASVAANAPAPSPVMPTVTVGD